MAKRDLVATDAERYGHAANVANAAGAWDDAREAKSAAVHGQGRQLREELRAAEDKLAKAVAGFRRYNDEDEDLSSYFVDQDTRQIFEVPHGKDEKVWGFQVEHFDQPQPIETMGSKDSEAFDFEAHLARQREWSERTFGPGERSEGVVDHIRKELDEIEAEPDDLSEWIDVVILALDGAWRIGASPEQIIAALVAKQSKNEVREWPDWRTAAPGKAIEHVRDDSEKE